MTKILGQILGVLIAILIVKFAWNYAGAPLFGWPKLTYLQALGIFLLFQFFTYPIRAIAQKGK
jgi:hypothetical protein